jgi:hypothetical protein
MNKQADPEVKLKHIESAVNDITRATSLWFTTQRNLGKSFVRRCLGDPRADTATISQQTLDGMTNSFGNLIDGWFGWVQLLNALTGSRYWPNPQGSVSTIYTQSVVVVPGGNITTDMNIVSSPLADDNGNQIAVECITLDPTFLQAVTDSVVTVEVNAPLTTVSGVYKGTINNQANGNAVFPYAIEI